MPDPKGPVIVDVFGRTDVGRTREHNEDAFVVADLTNDNPSLLPSVRTHQVGGRGSLFMVADGMGGAAAGEIASAMAVDVVLEELRARWLRGSQRDGESFASAIRAAASAANGKIHLYAGEHPELRGMGTTATIAGILGDTLFVGQVGDSRAYLVRAGTIRQITKDQSLIQKLVEAGELTEADAEQSDRRNIILQALGPEAAVRVDLTHQQVRRGDVLVLCSDGLSGQVKKEEIAEVVAAEPDLARVCRELIDRANAAGGPDNITVVAARFDGDGLEPPSATDAVGHQVLPMPGDESQTPTLPVQRYVPRAAPAPVQDATVEEPKPASPATPQEGIMGRRVLLATIVTIAGAATALALLRLMGAGSR
ncbi:MAG: protein phosphatase 2C domain-containing protein [Gemmatimonadaceae bacterium]